MRRKGVIIAIAGIMVILLAAAAIYRHGPGAYDRYRQYYAAHSSFKAEYQLVRNGKEAASGTLLIERPNRMLLIGKGPHDLYSASSTSQGYVEIDTRTKTYDESSPSGTVAIYASRISPLFRTAPMLILVKDLKAALPASASVSVTADGDRIHGINKGPMGESELWVDVDTQGRIPSYRVKETRMGEVTDQVWKISYQYPRDLREADFLTPLPMGFMPYALNRTPTPLQKGQELPLSGWKQDGKSGFVNLMELAQHNSFLLALVDEQEPSQNARKSLSTLRAHLPVLIVGPGQLADPSGKLLSKINAPGTPMFFLADTTGKIVKLWYGYDPEHAHEFEQGVLDALPGVPAPKKP